MFCNLTNLTIIDDLDKLDTSIATDATSMFRDCESLTELDLSNFDTSNVTIMDEMFYYCVKLQKLALATNGNKKFKELSDEDIIETDAALTSMNADYYEFCISDGGLPSKSSNGEDEEVSDDKTATKSKTKSSKSKSKAKSKKKASELPDELEDLD